jgi:hypothetical protein
MEHHAINMHVGMNAEPTHSFSQHYMLVSGYVHALLASKEPLGTPRQHDMNME